MKTNIQKTGQRQSSDPGNIVEQINAYLDKPRKNGFELFAVWSSISIYFVTYLFTPYYIMGESFWYIGVIMALVCVVAHAVSISMNDHELTCADDDALKLVFPIVVIMGVILGYMGAIAGKELWFKYVFAFITSYGISNTLGFLYRALLSNFEY